MSDRYSWSDHKDLPVVECTKQCVRTASSLPLFQLFQYSRLTKLLLSKKFLNLLHWKSWKKGGSSQYCFVHLTRCLSTSGGPGKHRFGSANDAVPGNHLPCRNHTYRYVDTRRIPLEDNPDDRYCTRYLSRRKQSKQNPKKMWQIEKWNISKMFTYVGNAYLKNTLLSSVTFVSFVSF